jgi:hypothetical protein
LTCLLCRELSEIEIMLIPINLPPNGDCSLAICLVNKIFRSVQVLMASEEQLTDKFTSTRVRFDSSHMSSMHTARRRRVRLEELRTRLSTSSPRYSFFFLSRAHSSRREL